MAPSAQEMDEARKRNTAYEYLCHLEEAKIWMEAVLGEKLPPATQLEEALRNGVYLARLAHIVTPEEVPLNRIYDREQRRYKVAGLQFRHTDNINYWIRSLRATELPRTFHPETTDVYDKKNMPRVVYCIHALSTHLFKLGLAPAIEDLYGKVQFSEADISQVQQDLDEIGVPIPAFQKIGSLLSASNTDDEGSLNKALEEIDRALEEQNRSALIRALRLPAAKLQNIDPALSDSYQRTLQRARSNKRQDAYNRSLNDSYEAADCSETLDVADIQGHINNVNGRHAVKRILRAVESCKSAASGHEQVAEMLSAPILQLKNVRKESAPEYSSALADWNGLKRDSDMAVLRQHLQRIIDRANRASKPRVLAAQAMDELYSALDSGNLDAFASCLQNPALPLDASVLDPIAFPLYFSELRMDRAETGMAMSLAELTSSVQMLSEIAKVTRAVDSGDVERTWKALNNPSVPLVGLEPQLKVQYMQALSVLRETSGVLSFGDLQSAVEQVASQSDQQSKMVGGLQAINAAVRSGDTKALMSELRNPALAMGGTFVDSAMILDTDGALLLRLLRERKAERASTDGAELWLEDVQAAAQRATAEIHDARSACYALARLNLCLSSPIVDAELHACIDCLAGAGLLTPMLENGRRLDESTLLALKDGLKDAWKSKKSQQHHRCATPWISHKTRGGFTAYFNMDSFAHAWEQPSDFSGAAQHLDHSDVQRVFQTCQAGTRSRSSTAKNGDERHLSLLTNLQARCRGFLLRQSIAERRAFWQAHIGDVVRIQAWWRGALVRQRIRPQLQALAARRRKQHKRQRQSKRDDLEHYRRHEWAVVLVQALWRGRRARKAFLSLVHQQNPPFRVIRLFAPLLEFTTDDYERELALQSLRGKVVQRIRHNQQLSQHLDAMDIKIGLLVQHRISLQDVVAHGKTLNSLARSHEKGSAQGSHTPGGPRAQCTLKMLTREGRRLLDGYRHLFYTLQTSPHYLAKLLIQLPQSRSTKFLQNVILSLFNFGADQREEYLLLRLFQSALEEDIRCKCAKLSDAVTASPYVLKMVVNYARQHSGQNALRTMIGPLIERILNDKNVSIETNPVDIYKAWRNQIEMETGKTSDLPYSVSAEEALSYREVRCRLNSGLQMLQEATTVFLEKICDSKSLIPYGLLFIARTLQRSLLECFPCTPEKDILKIVGNLIYYQLINSAIVAPDAFDIVTLPADRNLSNEQRRNLASIAKILQFAASKKGFGEESQHLVCLNQFIVECHERFKEFFRQCCDVEDLEQHFSVDRYSEAKLRTEPLVYMTLQEILDTHNLLLQYEDQIAPDPMDPLHELLEDLGGPPGPAQLLGGDQDTPVQLLQMEVCLALANKFSAAEEDTSDLEKLLVKTKELLVVLLPFLQGDDLVEALAVPDTPAQQFLYEERLRRRDKEQTQLVALNPLCDPQSCWSLRDCKQLLRRYLSQLELAGLASGADSYQAVVTSLSQDLCHKWQYRQERAKELASLRSTLASLDEKSQSLQEQVDFYDQYIQRCLENLSAGKRKVHAPRSDGRAPRKMRCKMTLKYSAARLQEKGVLLEVEGLPSAQLKNVTFEIAPTSTSGVFSIKGKFMGVEMEKIDVDIQHLLELQFDGVSIMDMFGKAKVNVNLLLFLLNQKFYGKT